MKLMKLNALRIFLLAVVVVGLLAGWSGCKTKDPGSQEYIPQKGWRPVQ